MENDKQYPRLLILANSCLSATNSNGRTLQNFLIGWPAEKIAQFYIKNQLPDFSVCRRYFRVTDRQALDAFLGKEAKGERILPQEAPGPSGSEKRSNRNPVTMLLRELVWNSGRWKKSGFIHWVEEFAPQVILLQAGDSGFMLRLARTLARRYGIPLVIYNSEAYYFKKHNYFRTKGAAGWLYPLFRWNFRRELGAAVAQASVSIYINEELKQAYDDAFSAPSVCIYTGTQIHPKKTEKSAGSLRVAYLGNTGVGRHEQLVELAQILRSVSPGTRLDVYGSVTTDAARQALEGCPAICYHGLVPYEQVLRVMAEADVLVHVENFSDFYRKDSRYAFSTKIADSLASGTCFLLYAPEELVCTAYIRQHEAGYTATDPEQLEQILRRLCTEPESRSRYLDNARALVEKNHRAQKNAAAFQALLTDAWHKG